MIDRAADRTGELSFSMFFDEQYAAAVRSAYLLTGSRGAAEDVAQDAFRAMWEHWTEIVTPAAYLWRTLTNGARSWGRVEHRLVRLPTVALVEGANADEIAVRGELACLPQGQREAIVLRYYLGLSDTEVAEAMGCPLGTAKSHVRRGLDSMRRALQ